MCYRKLRVLSAAAIVLVTASACSADGRSPVGPESAPAPPGPDPNYSETVHLQGRITSEVDGSPLEGAIIKLHDLGLCNYWAMLIGECSEIVTETSTDRDGRFSMSHSPCTPGDMRVEIRAKGYSFTASTEDWGIAVDCTEGVQDISAVLELVPLSLGVGFPVQATVGDSTHIRYRAYAHDGLAWVSVDWGDGSPPDRIELTGREAEGKVFHRYDTAGDYFRRVEVADASGRTRAHSMRIGVHD